MANGRIRRIFPAMILLVLAAAIVIFVLGNRSDRVESASGKAVPKGQRSVVLVTVDTTRADHLQPYGAEDIATPTFLRLAREGVVFERAYSVAPITLVAHTSILSGLYPFEHGVRNNGIQYVPEDVTTLAETLKDEGYRTGAFISAAVLDSRYGLTQGFDVYDDDLSTGRDRNPRTVADRPAEAVVASATKWLESLDEGDDYFLWVHLYDPHAVYSPPAPYRDRYRNRLYDGEIAYMDAQIGVLLDHPRIAVEDPDEAPAVVVMGDHGESLGEHGEQTHAILAYDSTLHIPFLMTVPGGPEGLRIPETVSQVDLVPTLLDLLELDPYEDIRGKSLLPLLAEPDKSFGRRSLYSETYLPYYTYGWAKLRVLRQGRWKLIDAPTPELFDLGRDPRELANVFGDQPGQAHDLDRDLTEMLGSVEDSEQEASLSLDAESEEKLRSLGYLASGSTRERSDADRPDPKDVIDLHVGLERARTMMRDRLFDRAELKLREVLERDPENMAALIDLVSVYEGQRDIEEAVKVAERALELDPNYLRLYVVMARLEMARGRTEQALELMELATSQDERNPDMAVSYAAILQRVGRQDEAVAVLEDGLAKNPDHPRLNANYARTVEMGRGQFAEAEERLRRVVALDPFMPTGWQFLGRLLEAVQRPDEAVESYREGLRRSSDNAELHGVLGTLLAKRGNPAEATQHLRESIRLSSGFQAALHVSLGGLYAEAGRLDEARREYDKVLAVQPKHPGARNNLAIALYRAGEAEEAKSLLQALTEDVPNHADAHNNLAAIAIDSQDWPKAERHARRTLELDNTSVQAWNNLGIAREELSDPREARSSYERALALDSEYWPAHLNLAILLRKQGEAEAAAAAFGEVLSRTPGQPQAHFELGELFGGPLGEPERARNHYRAFLRHAPRDPRVGLVQQRLESLVPAPPGG